MRVFVTGASGYLGLHVVTHLVDAGHTVTALVRDPARLGPLAANPAVTARVTDLRDRGLDLTGHDACVHLALIWGAPEDDLELHDVTASARLFDAAGRAGIGRAIYTSSTAVHRPFVGVMREADPLTPTDLYGAVKAAGEGLLWSACATYGMAGTVLRVGPVVGPPAFEGGAFRSNRRIARLVEDALAGRPLVVDGIDRQFVAADDVARVIDAALGAPGGTLLCLDAAVTRWAEIAWQIVSMTGSQGALRIDEAPGQAMFATDRLAEVLGMRLDSRAAMNGHIAHLIARHCPPSTSA